ncbi:MAG: N-acetylmuramoyl-L-alanine amidase [Fimbriimonadales bacterium]|nr:N-acetylmuramoyl-L-alanine amidase [Fimbriimonadales bacterium]MDW8051820.1 N-acetylmuramoyl-L-alanine amidase [Armatimonadota bacterium]
MRRHALGLALALIVCLAWADDLREARLAWLGETLELNPPALWDGRELWLPIAHLERLGIPLEVHPHAVRLPHLPTDQPSAYVPLDAKRGHPCVPLRDLVRRWGGFTRWDEANQTLVVLARLQEVRLEYPALHFRTSLPVVWRAFVMQDPARLVIDLVGCALPEVPLPLPASHEQVKAVRVGQFDSRTVRVVLEMDAPAATPESGLASEWQLLLASSHSPALAAEPSPVLVETPAPPAPPPPPFELPPLRRDARGWVSLSLPLPEGVQPRVAFLENPLRIALDVPGYLPKPVERAIEDPNLFVRIMRAAPIEGGRVRLVLELARSVGVQILSGKTGITLNLRLPRNAGGKLSQKVIVIDPGHGGAQAGARWREGNKVIEEKTITLAIGLQVAELLAREGATVILTRSEDKFVGLYERTALANSAGAHFFVSIHCDSNPRPNSASGTTVYYHRDDADSRALGQAILNEIVKVSGLPSRGVRSDTTLYQKGLAVLRTSQMPAVLIEVGFLNHSVDRAKLIDPAFQKRVAEAIVRGLRAYVEGQ